MSISNFESNMILMDRLAVHYSFVTNLQLTGSEIIRAFYIIVCNRLNTEWEPDIWDMPWEENEAREKLDHFDFSALFNTFMTDRSILSGLPLIERKARFKAGGIVWVIHRYDPDPFPSNPHAHAVDSGHKLDLSNGFIYKRQQVVKSLRLKDLLEVRTKAAAVHKGPLPDLTV